MKMCDIFIIILITFTRNTRARSNDPWTKTLWRDSNTVYILMRDTLEDSKANN